jgi:hypothetical protein
MVMTEQGSDLRGHGRFGSGPLSLRECVYACTCERPHPGASLCEHQGVPRGWCPGTAESPDGES